VTDRRPPTDPAPGDSIRTPAGDSARPATAPSRRHAEIPPPSGGPDPDGDAEREAAWAARPLDPRDYSRRTLLANERTYLAWWRTGLTAIAAALAAARVVPELADADERWPYTLLGAAFALAGLLAIAVGHVRRAEVDEAVRRGEFPPLSRVVALTMTGLGLVVGAATVVVIFVAT
jgi:putative membrane protein